MNIDDIVSGLHLKIELKIDNSSLRVDANKPMVALTIDDIQIKYCPGKYSQVTPEFLDREIELHRNYRDALRIYQETLIQTFIDKTEAYSNAKRTARFLPEDFTGKITRAIFSIGSILTIPIVRRRFTSWMKFHLGELKREARRYGYFSRAAEYGRELIQNALDSQPSSAITEGLQELDYLSRDIISLHRDIHQRKQNVVRHYEERLQWAITGKFPG